MKTPSFIKFIRTQLAYAMLLVLCSCSDGGSSDTSGGRGSSSSNPGAFTLSITDAAVDEAQEVWVQFTGATLQPTNGNTISYTFDSVKNINLLNLQGTQSTELISNEVIPLGRYNWIRLHVNASNDGINDSYIKLNDGSEHELWIPSGSQTGLKINTGFEFTATNELHLMIDFDLRKSVVLSSGNYKLRPTLRMINMNGVGSITGSIDMSLLTAASCSDADPATGNAVYLFEGENIIPDDMDNQNPEPVTSARVELNTSSGNYEYIIGFVPATDYTLAFTCQADLDEPNSNDNIAFSLSENVTVTTDSSDEDNMIAR